jgi:hypothetical protein
MRGKYAKASKSHVLQQDTILDRQYLCNSVIKMQLHGLNSDLAYG